MMGDRDLIESLRQGRHEAWTELVERYLRLVYHVVRKTLATHSRAWADPDVEDITGDLFQSLVADRYRVLGTIGPPYDLKAWLAVSARRRAIDFARRKRGASISLDEDGVENGIAAPEAESETKAAEAQSVVREAMEGLNPKERLVVQLFYLKGRKYREISKITGMNANSISPTLLRAVEKMQKCLKEKNLLST